MTEGFDVGLEMSGAPAAFEQMVDIWSYGGQHRAARHAGQAVAWSTGPRSSSSMLTIKGIYGREMFETWHKMIAMLQSGLDVRKVITHRSARCRTSCSASRRCGAASAARSCWTGRTSAARVRAEDSWRPVHIRPLAAGDAAAAARLIREAFAAQSRATDPPSGALGETTASVAAKLAEGGGAGAEAAGALVGVVLWAEQDGALYIGRVSVAPALARAGHCARPAGGGRSGSAPARPSADDVARAAGAQGKPAAVRRLRLRASRAGRPSRLSRADVPGDGEAAS